MDHVRHFCVDTSINIKLRSSFNTGPIDIVRANNNVTSAYLPTGNVMALFVSANHSTKPKSLFCNIQQLANISFSPPS